MFSRIGPQALPGTAFQGIIPEIPQQKKPLILAINTHFLFLSPLFRPPASCVPILGIRTLTSRALSWQEELKQLTQVALSSHTEARCQGMFSDVVFPYGSQMVGWVFALQVQSHTAYSPLERDELHPRGTWHLLG